MNMPFELEQQIAKEFAGIVKAQFEAQLAPLREKIVALEAQNAILRGTVTDLTSRLARTEAILETKNLRVVVRGAA
jgi:hypothetical protein